MPLNVGPIARSDAASLAINGGDTTQIVSSGNVEQSYPAKMNGDAEQFNFPIGGSVYKTPYTEIPLRPYLHMQYMLGMFQASLNHDVKFAMWKEDHITSDDSSFDDAAYVKSNNNEYPIEYQPGTRHPLGEWNLPDRNSHLYQFRGAVTFINPEHDEEKQYVMDFGLEKDDIRRNGKPLQTFLTEKANTGFRHAVLSTLERDASPGTPTSPIHPFTRVYAERARNAITTSYNRTKLPIADIEHRKAIRYIFITRPECYLMAGDDKPSMQCLNDDDMSTCWMRFPHIIRMLSPVYVTTSTFAPEYANWNWLLCNRVQGMTTGQTTLNLVDSTTKSVRGATVVMGKNIGTNLGGTLELSFRDTKYMDVYEMLRIWMLYIHKRRMGTFFPSYNGYQQVNGFYHGDQHKPFSVGATYRHGYSVLHPYDRALDYCASVYDIVTNETGTKILYWCKYYGVYPVSISNGMLTNTNNSALTSEAIISGSFQYQYKQENIFKNLIEFNYNAGICDHLGNMRDDVSHVLRNSVPFLCRDNGIGGTAYTNKALKNYIGAASMFTGSPYIVTQYSGTNDPWDWSKSDGTDMVDALLCFVPVFYGQMDTNEAMNLGITSETVPNAEQRSIMVLQSHK